MSLSSFGFNPNQPTTPTVPTFVAPDSTPPMIEEHMVPAPTPGSPFETIETPRASISSDVSVIQPEVMPPQVADLLSGKFVDDALKAKTQQIWKGLTLWQKAAYCFKKVVSFGTYQHKEVKELNNLKGRVQLFQKALKKVITDSKDIPIDPSAVRTTNVNVEKQVKKLAGDATIDGSISDMIESFIFVMDKANEIFQNQFQWNEGGQELDALYSTSFTQKYPKRSQHKITLNNQEFTVAEASKFGADQIYDKLTNEFKARIQQEYSKFAGLSYEEISKKAIDSAAKTISSLSLTETTLQTIEMNLLTAWSKSNLGNFKETVRHLELKIQEMNDSLQQLARSHEEMAAGLTEQLAQFRSHEASSSLNKQQIEENLQKELAHLAENIQRTDTNLNNLKTRLENDFRSKTIEIEKNHIKNLEEQKLNHFKISALEYEREQNKATLAKKFSQLLSQLQEETALQTSVFQAQIAQVRTNAQSQLVKIDRLLEQHRTEIGELQHTATSKKTEIEELNGQIEAKVEEFKQKSGWIKEMEKLSQQSPSSEIEESPASENDEDDAEAWNLSFAWSQTPSYQPYHQHLHRAEIELNTAKQLARLHGEFVPPTNESLYWDTGYLSLSGAESSETE